MLGYCHLEAGKLPSTKAKEARKHFAEAAKFYLLAAASFAKDDEKHVGKQYPIYCTTCLVHRKASFEAFLSMAVQAHWRRGTSLRLTYLLSKRVWEDKAIAERIWLRRLTKGQDFVMDGVLSFKEDCDNAIASGKMTLDDVVQPEVGTPDTYL